MIWYSHWFIHPDTAISTKRNGSSTSSIVVHSSSRACPSVRNYRRFKQFRFSVHTPFSDPDEVVRYVPLQSVIGTIGWNLGLKRTGRELHKAKEELDDLAARR